MTTSNTVFDSISISDNYFFSQDYSTIGIVIQDSIKWEAFKILAVYKEDKYLGNYRISSKVVFEAKKFPDIFCRLLWSKPKEECNREIQNLKKWGKFSDKMPIALISFHFHSTNEAYKIKRIIKEFEAQKKTEDYPF